MPPTFAGTSGLTRAEGGHRVMSKEPQALLVTGVPGSGKTTIIEKVAAALTGKRIGGFVTSEIRRAGRRVGFELTTFTGEEKLFAHVEIDSHHRVGRYGVDVEVLDEIAEKALALDDTTDVYLVDEIGKMECFSAKFRAAMRVLLDSGRPLVATVGLRGSGFIAEVKSRADVEIWTVTKASRNQMPKQIVQWLNPHQRLSGRR
jgi:nucleoside-triphosphatase